MYLDETGSVDHYTLLRCDRGNGMPPCGASLFPNSVRFGSSLALLGDVDGDGILNELAVGAVGWGASQHGAVYILQLEPQSGSAEGISIITDGNGGLPPGYLEAGSLLGYSLAWLGDLDGDGSASELAAGAYDGVGFVLIMWLASDRTVSHVLELRNGLNGVPLGTVAPGSVFGGSLAFLGDLDGDGETMELSAGLRGADVGAGALLVFQLRPNGTVSNVVRTDRNSPGFDEDALFSSFGFSLDWIGDFDGDGTASELAVGGEGLTIVSLDPATLQPRRDKNASVYSAATLGLPANKDAGCATALLGQVGTDPSLSTVVVGARMAQVCQHGGEGTVHSVRLRSSVGARWAPPAAAANAFEGLRPMGGSRVNITFTELVGLPLAAVRPHVGGRLCSRPRLLSASQLSCTLPPAGGDQLIVTGSANGRVLDPAVALDVGWHAVKNATAVWTGSSLGTEVLVAGARAGASIAFIGDLDQDGIASEFLIGVPGDSTVVSTRSGAVLVAWVQRGVVVRTTRIATGAGGLPADALSDESAFGSAVAWVGDLLRTGQPSVVAVGAPGDASAGAADSGAVFVLTLDPQTGRASATTKLYAGVEGVPSDLQPGCQFGAALASAPDPRSGGGVLLLVGAPKAGTGATGALHVLSLSRAKSPGALVTATLTISGGSAALSDVETPAGSQLGTALAWLGDLDGNSATGDFAVGAPGRPGGGAVLLFRLSDSGVDHAGTLANGVHLPPDMFEATAQFGRSIAWLGEGFDGQPGPGSFAVGVAGGLAIATLAFPSTDQLAFTLGGIQLLDSSTLGLPAASASAGAALAALGSGSPAGGYGFSILVAADGVSAAMGAAWLVELDVDGANVTAQFATGVVPRVVSVEPRDHLSWLGTSTISVVGSNFTLLHPLVPPVPQLYFPPRLVFSGAPSNQTCSNLFLSEPVDGMTVLSCTAPPSLVTTRNITVWTTGAFRSAPVGVMYDVSAEVSGVEDSEPLDQTGGRTRAFTGTNLLPSSVFSDKQLVEAGVGQLAFGDSYTCPLGSLLRSADGSRIECTSMPPGVGGPHQVRLLVAATGKWSASSATVTYAAPTIVSISPNDVRLHASAKYAFDIRGTGFGSVEGDVTVITIGGNRCGGIEWNSSSLVRCTAVDALFKDHDVVVTTDRVASNGGTRLLVFPDPPRVVGVTPALVPTVGGANVTCFGTGYDAASIASVLVGGKPCSHWALISSFGLLCTTPPGTGRDKVVTVITPGGISTPSLTPLVSYEPPTIVALSPDVAFSDPSDEYTFTITGTGFGVLDGGQVSAASVGGRACSRLEHVDDANILCHNVSAPWLSRLVRVVVGGQETLRGGLFDFQPRPEVTSLLPTTSSTAGGTMLTIAGKGFGGGAEDIDAIYLGSQLCPLVEHVSAVALRCMVPPGVGSGLAVQVVTTRNGASPEVSMFSYHQPQVTALELVGNESSVRDDYVFVGTPSVDLKLSVVEVGASASAIDSVTLRMLGQAWSSECASHEAGSFHPTTGQLATLLCHGVSLAGAPDGGGQVWAAVAVGGQSSSQPEGAEALLTAIGRPTLSLVTPSGDIPTGGLGNASTAPATVVGANFGNGPADVLAARLGDTPCPLVEWESSTGLQLAFPAGVGARRSLRVQTRGGLWSEPFPVSYRRAEVATISPSYVFTGAGNASFNITGVAFGVGPTDLTSIRVGGRPCGRSVWVSPTLVRCLDTPRFNWPASSVLVTVGEQPGVTSNLLTVIGRPRISVVSPTMAAPGDDLLLLGSGFGDRVEDIRHITVAGELCRDVRHPAAAALSCTMPPPPPLLLLAAVSDPRLLLDHDVIVTTDGGMSSLPGKVSFQGGGTPISAAPSLVRSWRPVEQPTTIVVRWAFPAFDPSDGVAEIESFDIQLSLTVNETTGGLQRQLLTVQAEAAAPSRETADGFIVYQHSDFVFATQPVVVQVRANNPTGPGPWSNPTAPVAENCGVAEFLEDNVPVHEWQCRECPTGAFCGGAGAGNVTALGGFWRVPWSPAGLGFARCTFAAACLGSGSSNGTASDVEAGVRRLQRGVRGLAGSTSPSTAEQVQDANPPPTAVPASRLSDPTQVEGCHDGYSGTMCSSCTYGFTRWGAAQCARCRSGVLVGLALVGITLFLCAVISYLVLSALRSGQQDKSMTTAVVKILFSHVQTVAIAASFDLEWPDSALALFATMTSATSVSSDVLSLDCVMNGLRGDPGTSESEAGRSLFFEKAAVVLAMPLLLVFGAATFWTLVGPVVTKCCCAGVEPGMTSQPLSLRSSGAAPGISTSPAPTPPPDESATSGVAGRVNPMVGAATKQGQDLKWMLKGGRSRKSRLRRAVTSKLSISAKYVGISLSLGDKILTTAVVIMFLVHMSVTQVSLQLLTCVNVVADGTEAVSTDGLVVPAAAGSLATTLQGNCDASQAHRRLLADLEVCCYDPDAQSRMYGLGIPGLLVYAVGIPVAGAVLLFLHRHKLGQIHTKVTLGFIFAGFKGEAYYWESVVMLRKVGVAAIAVLMAPLGAALQTYAALLLIFVLALVHQRMQPYELPSLNHLELGALVTAYATFECGLFLTADGASHAVQVAATLTILAVNVSFLACGFAVMGWDTLARRCVGQRQSEEEGNPVHQRDETLLEHLQPENVGTVESRIADNVGTEQVETYKRLLEDPSVLDGPEGPLLSSQMAAYHEAQRLLPTYRDEDDMTGKQVTKYGTQKDSLVLEDEGFPLRPPETGPGDQLMLGAIPEERQLAFGDMLEVFARHRANPDKYTASVLAEMYETEERWMEALLRYGHPATVVEADNQLYGVYEVRDVAGDRVSVVISEEGDATAGQLETSGLERLSAGREKIGDGWQPRRTPSWAQLEEGQRQVAGPGEEGGREKGSK